ncbi:hypothetical protein AB1Y20_001492 [Prymnesium parvum]|uniref:SET domain-containing protein n=1 Tax=Prymnesium parvum TaxID=97485 RepID=A0AB34KB89_PRYPA
MLAALLLLSARPLLAVISSPTPPKPLSRPAVAVVSVLSDLRWTYTCLVNGWRPLVLGRDVAVRSTGDARGDGLFALRDLEAGQLVERYTGVCMTDEEYESCDSLGNYAFELGNGVTMDGEDPRKSSFVRYINHSVRRANCEAFQAWDENDVTAAVYIETKRPIRAGEELLFDYGSGYWDSRAPRFSPSRIMIDYF